MFMGLSFNWAQNGPLLPYTFVFECTLSVVVQAQRSRPPKDKNYFVENLEDVMRIAGPGTEEGALAMMVLSYWEQACALVNYGLLHEDLFFETSGEFFAVWERVKPIVPQARERFVNKHFLGHLERAAQRYEAWIETRSPGHIAGMRQFMNQMRAQFATAAKA